MSPLPLQADGGAICFPISPLFRRWRVAGAAGLPVWLAGRGALCSLFKNVLYVLEKFASNFK